MIVVRESYVLKFATSYKLSLVGKVSCNLMDFVEFRATRGGDSDAAACSSTNVTICVHTTDLE